MPKILFASNNVADFVNLNSYLVTQSYDSNRVPYSILLEPNRPSRTQRFAPTTTDDTWFHCSLYNERLTNNSIAPFMTLYDDENEEIVSLQIQTTTIIVNTTRNGVASSTTFNAPIQSDVTNTIDMQVKITAISTEVTLYLNQVRLGVAANGASGNLSARPTFLQILGTIYGEWAISEIIIADGDTRNARLNVLVPSDVAFYNEWEGNLSSLQDNDSTTGLTTTEPDRRMSFDLTEYTGSTNISNVVAITTAMRGVNAPESINHFIRLSNVDYDDPAVGVDLGRTLQVTDWEINPATSLPWTAVDLANIQIGFQSKA